MCQHIYSAVSNTETNHLTAMFCGECGKQRMPTRTEKGIWARAWRLAGQPLVGLS